MNRELLLKVADLIENEPERYDQTEWVRVVIPEYEGRYIQFTGQRYGNADEDGGVVAMSVLDFHDYIGFNPYGLKPSSSWQNAVDPDYVIRDAASEWGDPILQPCNTRCCIAGHLMYEAGWRYNVVEGNWIDPSGTHRSSPLFGYEAQLIAGIDERTADILFSGSWRPREGMTVPEALRALVDGETIGSVSE